MGCDMRVDRLYFSNRGLIYTMYRFDSISLSYLSPSHISIVLFPSHIFSLSIPFLLFSLLSILFSLPSLVSMFPIYLFSIFSFFNKLSIFYIFLLEKSPRSYVCMYGVVNLH